MNVAIGLPTVGPPTWTLLEGLMGLQRPGGKLYLRTTRKDGVDVAKARTLIGEWFLEGTDAEYLLMVDRDASLHPGTLMRLLSWEQPIVSALCFCRHIPVTPTVYRGTKPGMEGFLIQVYETRKWLHDHPELWTKEGHALLDPAPKDSLTRVDATGAHCLLVRRDVFEEIDKPWFVANEWCSGEDNYFCRQATRAGFPVFVDRSVISGHLQGEVHPLGALQFLAHDAITDWDKTQFRVPWKEDGKFIW